MVEELKIGDKQTSSVSDVLDLKFNQAAVKIGKQVKEIEDFKGTIGNELTELAAHADRVMALVTTFATSGDPSLRSRQDISAGLEVYFQFAKSAKDQVLKMLDEEVRFCKNRLVEMQAEKDALISKIQSVVNQSKTYLAEKPGQILQSRFEAVKTLRKIPQFGMSVGTPDFEWPKPSDLMAMPEDQPIRVVGFNWKKCDSDKKTMAGIQVILSNEQTSPLFLARNTTEANIERVNITSDQRIRKIKGQQGLNSNVSEIYFYDATSNLITQMVADIVGGYDTILLGDGEEIIGIYGTKNRIYDNLDTLGFIVWRPYANQNF